MVGGQDADGILPFLRLFHGRPLTYQAEGLNNVTH